MSAMNEHADLDDDDLLERLEEEHWTFMRLRGGYSEEDISRAKQRKRFKEEVNVMEIIIKTKAWEFDISCSFTDTYLRLAMALESLTRRKEAIGALKRANSKSKGRNTRIALALAKLLFKDDQKKESLALCRKLAEQYKAQNCQNVPETGSSTDRVGSDYGCDCGSGSDSDDGDGDGDSLMSEEDVSQAYYLAGWTYIHDDNHSEAYRTWSEGHLVAPSSALLARQHRKRQCWDDYDYAADCEGRECEWAKEGALIGGGAYGDRGSWSKQDFDAFALDSSGGAEGGDPCSDPPAVSLFHHESQQRELVFRSHHPLLLPEECRNVLHLVERYHAEELGGQWGTVRASSVKTTDVAVEDVPGLRLWLLRLLHSRLYPIIAALFPILGDGSTTMTSQLIPESFSTADEATQSPIPRIASRMRVHDAFIVRYDAENAQSLSLPEHCDTSAVSVVVALNSATDGDYSGGGTWFEALAEKGTVVNAEVGRAVLFAGPLKHAGFPITRGVRNILVLFLYIEDFHYGPLIQSYRRNVEERKLLTQSHPQLQGSKQQQEEGVVFRSHNVSRHVVTSLLKKNGNSSCSSHGLSKEKPEEDSGGSESAAPKILNSGGQERGYVVYRQTVELVNMLESSSLAYDE